MNKRFLFVCICSACIGVVISFMFSFDSRIKKRSEYGGEIYSLSLEDEEDLKRIAQFFDISVQMPSECENIRIPMKFNEMYENYNQLQYDIGMNLEEFRGEECILYTADIDENTVIHMISWHGQFIGGDISDRDFHGNIMSLSGKSA